MVGLAITTTRLAVRMPAPSASPMAIRKSFSLISFITPSLPESNLMVVSVVMVIDLASSVSEFKVKSKSDILVISPT